MAAPQRAQITQQTIPGHVIPALNGMIPLHPTAQTNMLQLAISLNLQNQEALQALLAAQEDPSSPYYHQYLTPQQFTAQFGPTQSTVDSVVSYLRSQNLVVSSVSSNHLIIDASGTVGNAEKAFNVTLYDYNYHGNTIYAPSTNPSVPAYLASVIQNIGGLSNIPRIHYASMQHKAAGAQHAVGPLIGPGGGYTPTELRTAYGVDSLISSGNDGTGQTIAVFELDGYSSSDIDHYRSNYGLGTGRYTNVLVDGATNTPGSGAIEVELDMDIVSAIAPGATQRVYIGPNSTTGVNDTYNRIVTDNLAKVTTISWGLCEASSGNSELAALDTIFTQGAAQGQAFFAASGDSGAYDCNGSGGSGTTLAVDSPADDPYVVGVGGTNLQLGSGGTYGSESAWGNTSNNSGGGGGISSYFQRPAYQTGTNLTNANRMVPDVSADADPQTGYSVYCSTGSSYCSGWLSVGGTSGAAPMWASTAIDINQYLASQGKPVLGNAHQAFYNLYNNSQTYTSFHDVTIGNNLYYQAGPNYDLATGLGTPNAWQIANDLAGSSGIPTPTPTTTPTPTATPTPTTTPTPTPTPIPTAPPPTATPPPPGGTMQLVANGSFEDGSTPWVEHSGGGYELITSLAAHTGRYSALLCSYNNCNDSIYQVVTIPSNSNRIILSYWLYRVTAKRGYSACYDKFTAALLTSRGYPIRVLSTKCGSNSHGWVQFTFDVTSALSSYQGQQVIIFFKGTTTRSLPSSFLVDDVAITDYLNS
ncbi:protease pro-enzyme activation domain-containing protein [Dictyobacter formicarum]|uniref:Peptidase S53 domain-containing protein n=1 Tax=Dictyobacter formicarum TaxID=2778368 RepID=A0ABQ3VTZ4_9CHLR|nr:protease pro-enzyme activation domain-containing protein [Dictyobacter formicarum]GHO89293.1 hypothetical protein KSZ_72990 [Dictyobacter formicarum]